MKINVKNDTSIQIDNIPNEKIPSLRWLTLNGNEVPNIIDEIKKNIEYWSNIIEKDRLKFIVSCDSQRHGGKIVYVTTIVFLRKGLGGQGYFIREFYSEGILLNNKVGEKNAHKYGSDVHASWGMLEYFIETNEDGDVTTIYFPNGISMGLEGFEKILAPNCPYNQKQ